MGTSRPADRTQDRAFGWLLVVYFLLNFAHGVFPPLLPELMGALGLSFAAIGLVGTAFGVARLLQDLPAAALAGWIGPTRLMHVGVGLVLAGALIAAGATALLPLVLARGLIGFGSGLSALVALMFIVRAGPADQRTRRGNLFEAALIGSNAVSAFLAGMVSVRAGWRWSFAMAAAAVAVAWVSAAWWMLPAMCPALHDGRPSPAGGSIEPRSRASSASLRAIYLAAFGLAFGWAGGVSTLAPWSEGRLWASRPRRSGAHSPSPTPPRWCCSPRSVGRQTPWVGSACSCLASGWSSPGSSFCRRVEPSPSTRWRAPSSSSG